MRKPLSCSPASESIVTWERDQKASHNRCSCFSAFAICPESNISFASASHAAVEACGAAPIRHTRVCFPDRCVVPVHALPSQYCQLTGDVLISESPPSTTKAPPDTRSAVTTSMPGNDIPCERAEATTSYRLSALL